MDEITRQIESITGYNLVTKKKTNIRKLKIDSPLLEHSNILEKQKPDLKQAFINDIAKFYNLKPDQVNVRSIVRGSIELYFSLPEIESVGPDNIRQSDIPSVNNILQSNGINNLTVSNESILPNINKAIEIMENYVRPVIIKSDEIESTLMRKFGKYLPVLASLSSHVRIIHDKYKKTIEIHGPPKEKAKVLHYFAELEDALQGRSIENIEIISSTKLSDNYYDGLWNHLYQMAKDFALNDVNAKNRLQTNTLEINPYLKQRCLAARSFINALQRQGSNPNSYDEIFVNGVYGWHGTRSDKNIKSILENNLNITFRKGQYFGPGEYCATKSNYSIDNGYWGSTNTLIVFFILINNPFFIQNTRQFSVCLIEEIP